MKEKIRLYAFADEVSAFLDAQIRAMKRNGLSGVELRNTEFGDATKIRPEEAKEIRKKLEDAGLTTWSVGSPIGKIRITDPFGPHLEAFRHAIEIGELLGAKRFRLFSFYMPKDEDPAPYREEVIERLGRISDAAAGSGILLCHENEKRIYGDTAERIWEILSALPELRAVFDPANFVQCGVDTLEAWETLHPFVNYLHVKDAVSDGSVVPAGQGDGHVKEIVRAYLSSGGRDFTMEPHLFDFGTLWKLELTEEKSIVTSGRYQDADAAFDAAVSAFKALVGDLGYGA